MPASLDTSCHRTPLKIGILNDSTSCSKYVHDLVQWARTTPGISVEHLIEHAHPAHTAPQTRGLLRKLWGKLLHEGVYKTLGLVARSLIFRFEARFLSRIALHGDHGATFDLAEFGLQTTRITPQVSASGFVYRFSPSDIERVRSLGLDVLIRCGTGILRGDLLKAARFGVLSFHHADNRVNRGGPPGFWEVHQRTETTGFIIQQLTEELDGGNVLFRGQFRTEAYWLLNQASLFLKSNVYMKLVLERLAATRELPCAEPSMPYAGPLYRAPELRDALTYFARMLGSKLATMIKARLGIHPRWHVGVARADWPQTVMWRGIEIKNPAGHFLADPFVCTRDGRDFCFVEDYHYATNLGFITVYEIEPNGTATELGTALKEPFHLSFPYLFEHEGQLYMIPETSQNRDIRVYECVEFPLQWRLKTVLMRDVAAADTMVFSHGNKWWMLTNIDPANADDYCSTLSLFWADSPLASSWTPHPMNPIYVDASRARNGGLLRDGTALYRVSQGQGFATYGKRSRIHRIVELNEHNYQETCVAENNPAFGPDLIGTHHMHSNGRITVFDYCKASRIKR